MRPGCHAGAMQDLLLAAASEQMSKRVFVLVFCFCVFWNFFKAVYDLVPGISCAKIKVFNGSKKQGKLREI